jgi:hypothetical protein
MSRFERLEGEPPDKMRGRMIAFLVLILFGVMATIYWFSMRDGDSPSERRFAPSPVAPLGPK